MKIVKPSTEFYGAVPTDYKETLLFIEKCGRLCYKSENKITADSNEKFTKKLIKAGHLAMVEHSNFVVRTECTDTKEVASVIILAGKYLNVVGSGTHTLSVGGSLTAWFQAGKIAEWGHPMFDPFRKVYAELFAPDVPYYLLEELAYGWELCPFDEIPKGIHRYSVKFTCDRGVSHELVRHRPCSFAQESTRYVNYKHKDIEFIEPWWWHNQEAWVEPAKTTFMRSCDEAEHDYKQMIKNGASPQAARTVLTNALKTEIIVTCDLAEWKHIFKLRCAPSAHPDFVRLAVPLREEFVREGVI